MKLIDLTFPTPAENLACEEALLDAAESGHGGETLRFWESTTPFVVVGYANQVDTEVNRTVCELRRVPILRRCSGGGTVLQGPGCLNYSLILKIAHDGPLTSITSANRFIMEQNCTALGALLKRPVQVSGHTDLSVDGRKFSGNSQRRRRTHLLFHGTFLLAFDLALIGKCLAMPTRQPDYRKHRKHSEFITNIGLDAASIKAGLSRAWGASDEDISLPEADISRLVNHRYGLDEWNFKF